jgi:UTP--glucose-1-phosphate uridylyltransferase
MNSKYKPVRKAVIAAAGFGTRFLPQTKALPKEMLPVVDKPIIQYVVEELVEAGIEDIVIVTGYHKRSIEDHFDHISADLRANLKQGNKLDLLEGVKRISGLANFAYVRQKGVYGNATPLLNVEHLIGDEPFIYAWGDDFIKATPPRFSQMVSAYEQRQGLVLACIRAQKQEDYKKFGFVGGNEVEPGLIRMNKIIEKPGSPEASPSNIATVSGYLFEPSLFGYLKKRLATLEKGEEFWMQPAIQDMMDDGKDVWALEIQNGKFYDTGNKLEYLKTVVDFALENDEFGDEFEQYLHDKIKSKEKGEN